LDLDEPMADPDPPTVDPEPSGAHRTMAAVAATLRRAREQTPVPASPPLRSRPRVTVVEARLWLDLSDPGPGPADTSGPLLLVDLDDPGPSLLDEVSLDAPIIQLDPDGDFITSLTIVPTRDDLDAYDPRRPPPPLAHTADVLAEDGAVRVELALGGGPPDRATASHGVAVAPAQPVRRWTGRSEPDPDRSTDLVALARIEDSAGAPSAPRPKRSPGDNWLDAGEAEGSMSPYFRDTGPIVPPKPRNRGGSRKGARKRRKK
jgi:hypothetical protein